MTFLFPSPFGSASVDQRDVNEFSWRKNENVERYEITGVIDQLFIVNICCIETTPTVNEYPSTNYIIQCDFENNREMYRVNSTCIQIFQL